MDREFRGHMTSYEDPNWEPLVRLAPEHLDDFMWMFEAKLDDGTRLHAYKHCETRRYLHLSEDGRAFYYREPDIYTEIGACHLLGLVLRQKLY